MTEIPSYWKTRLSDVEDVIHLVKKGKVTRPAVSAGKRPIYVFEYGSSNLPPHRANCSSALGARDIKYYSDKSGADYNPTVFLCGCIHGGEFEGTAALVNLIKILETGTDYSGNAYPELSELASRVHLIIIPMVNPDGRSHVPFDTFVGRTFYELRYYNQGTWKDGSLCGWPECKALTPIKDHVDYLGAYFDDDGVNMMHEDFFSDKVSAGTRVILDICYEHSPDFSILLHGGTNSTQHMIAPKYSSMKVKKEIHEFSLALEEASKKRGVRYYHLPISNAEAGDIPPSFNLTSAMHHCCAECAVTYESNQGLCDEGDVIFTHDEIYLAHLILFEELMKFELKKFGKI